MVVGRGTRIPSLFAADRYRADNERTFKLLAIFMPAVKLVGNITTGVVLLYGGYRVLHGQMTIGTLAAFLLYLRMFFEPMQEISQFFNTFQSAASALEKLAGVLGERPGIQDPLHPVHLASVRVDVEFHENTTNFTSKLRIPNWPSSSEGVSVVFVD